MHHFCSLGRLHAGIGTKMLQDYPLMLCSPFVSHAIVTHSPHATNDNFCKSQIIARLNTEVIERECCEMGAIGYR